MFFGDEIAGDEERQHSRCTGRGKAPVTTHGCSRLWCVAKENLLPVLCQSNPEILNIS